MIYIEAANDEAVCAIELLQERALQMLREALTEEQIRLLPPPVGAVPVPDLNFDD